MSNLRLPPETLRQIIAEADAAGTDECCGLLLADGRVIAVENIAAEKHHRFTIDPLTLLRAEKQHGTIVGIYHSHPDAEPVPSMTDLAAAWPGYVYLICGRVRNDWLVRGWQLRGSYFVEVPLHSIETP